jgi:lysylphosphatidylglycerol synthetase-like protein (DUF2156 family)
MTSLALARPAQPPVLLLAAVQSRQQLAVARVALVALVVLTLVPALAWVAARATVRVLVCLRPLRSARRLLATTPKAAPLALVNSAGWPAQQATVTAGERWRQARLLAARPAQSDTDECALVTRS